METLTRLVTESLARHGFDRPIDYRRLRWSHWFRCESHHSLLIVPSKPGVFALAEEVMDLAVRKPDVSGKDHVETATSAVPQTQSEANGGGLVPEAESGKPEAESPRRMLAVTKFFEDDDMAYVLDRMISHENPMQARLASGRYFVRFVVIEDVSQRRSICSALNQWIASAAEKATGIGSHFATSLELTPATEQVWGATAPSVRVATGASPIPQALTPSEEKGKGSGTGNSLKNTRPFDSARPTTAPRLNSAIATTIHCSSSFPSGF
jgi:hypothetical protein